MPPRLPWTERTFNFDFPIALASMLLERLRGTPARVEEIVRPLRPALLRKRDGETWSIQQHVGHLADLEALFTGRLDDFDEGATTLRPADMTNQKTNEANHNAREIGEVLAGFRSLREQLVTRVETLDAACLARSAMHPRLHVPMRVVDMMLFHAEHDDHHLARIREVIRRYPQQTALGR